MSFFRQREHEQEGRRDFERGRSQRLHHEDFWEGVAYDKGYRDARHEHYREEEERERREQREQADERERMRAEQERRWEEERQELEPDPPEPEPEPEPERDPLVQAIIDVHNSDWDYHI